MVRKSKETTMKDNSERVRGREERQQAEKQKRRCQTLSRNNGSRGAADRGGKRPVGGQQALNV